MYSKQNQRKASNARGNFRLEDCIERSLVEGSRYEKGNPADYDRQFALDREKFCF